MTTRARARHFSSAPRFPLRVSANGRFLVTGDGQPFFLIGDALWELEVMARSTSDVDTILTNRASKGDTAFIMEAFEREYSDNTPKWAMAYNAAIPFTTTANSASMTWTSRTEAYWAFVDYIVAKAKSLGMVVVINPAYMGLGGTDGWLAALGAASNADLDNYGDWFGRRYGALGNVILCVGGDDAGDGQATTPGTERNKQARIITAACAVGNFLVTGHPARSGSGGATDGEAHLGWSTYSWFNLNSIYVKADASDAYVIAATAWGRSGPVRPFFMIESDYETGSGSDNLRKAMWQSVLSGACGALRGEFPRWALGAAGASGTGIADVIANHLNTAGDSESSYLRTLLVSYPWHTLVPKTDASLVTTSLGTGTGRVCPALASDGTFAMIYTPSVNVTVDMSQLTHSSVRARWFNVTTGAFTTDAASPLANSGTHAFTAPGERVLVLD
jgi:uncharacterized protein DUF4038/collagenase-like protein with putative collagen-binding domain